MTTRNFSMQAYWENKVENFTPKLHFCAQTETWESWRQTAHAKYMDLLGTFPDPVPLEAEVESSVEDDGLIRERVVFNSEPFMSVPCQVLRPKTMAADGTNAAILCSHGHGPFGKDPVAGIRSSDEMSANIELHNYDYGFQMAKAGYLTISPDLRGFGERRDGRNPFPGRDPCNVNYIRGTMLDRWPLTLNIWDMKCCIDYLETRPEVDPKRIGMMGLSQGGTMTTFAAAAEPRIAAADIMGYVNPWKGLRLRTRQLLRLADRPRHPRLVRHRRHRRPHRPPPPHARHGHVRRLLLHSRHAQGLRRRQAHLRSRRRSRPPLEARPPQRARLGRRRRYCRILWNLSVVSPGKKGEEER